MSVTEAAIRSDQGHFYGMFRFVELPRPGDRIAVADAGGTGDVLEVLYVLHNPIPVPARPFAQQPPIATVIIRLIPRMA